MKRIKLLIITILLLLFIPNVNAKEIKLYLFHQSTCPHCREERAYLETIKDKYTDLNIIEYEINTNKMNYDFLEKVLKETKIVSNSVPFTMIGNNYYVGFDDGIKDEIEATINKYLKDDSNYIDVIAKIKNKEDISDIKYNVDINEEKTIPILGKINAKEISLPLVSIIIGFVDGFNPCAMWVLLFLITMLINMKDKKKMWILGITFLVASALMYLLFMVAWLNVALSFMSTKIISLLIALVALIGGFINLRSYINSKKKDDGCEVVDDKKRKKIITKIKDIVKENNFVLALIGIITLAISVNLVELACSAGLPLIFTQILALNNLSTFEYSIYILLYILFFLIDDIIIFVIAMLTFNIKGISSKYGKYSHLIGGIIMVLIGLLMIFKPEWLTFNF